MSPTDNNETRKNYLNDTKFFEKIQKKIEGNAVPYGNGPLILERNERNSTFVPIPSQ